MTIEVHYLADNPDLTRLVATWFYEEWSIRNPESSVEKVEKRLLDRMNRDRLPLMLIALVQIAPKRYFVPKNCSLKGRKRRICRQKED